MKKYNQSPLPFQGQKRNFLKEFRTALVSYPEETVFVDLFGGSGLLSHTIKCEKPNSKVIYNDYDNFKNRLNNVSVTNKILEQIRVIVEGYEKGSKINVEDKSKIIKVIKQESKKGFIDFISLSSNVLFSMNYISSIEELEKLTFYANVRKSNYEVDGYLTNVELVKEDYKVLFEKYKNVSNVVFLIDPPYLSTDCSTYSNKFWKLKDYLDVLSIIQKNNYFYFTSNKSSVVELCKWMENNTDYKNPFSNAAMNSHFSPIRNNIGYTDMMLYKYVTDTTY